MRAELQDLSPKVSVGPCASASGSTIRTWSIQRAGAWDLFQKRRILRADGRRIWQNFRPAYRWLTAQMHERIPGYAGGLPVWLWYGSKPDLRCNGHLPRGERGVRIELEFPRDRVLLLDFETWHCVLNRWHLSRSWRDSEEWDRKTKGLDQIRGALPPRLEAELQETWQRVFDFAFLRRSKLWGPLDRIQGVAEYILLDDVRSVTKFVAR